MRKLKFNGRGITRGLRDIAVDPMFVAIGGASAFVAGLMGFISWLETEGEEVIAARDLREQKQAIVVDMTTSEQYGVNHELISPDAVRVFEMNLTRDFHFADRQIYVQTTRGGDKYFSIIDFDDVDNPKALEDINAIGCDIANKALSFPDDQDSNPDNFQSIQDAANDFFDDHCVAPQ